MTIIFENKVLLKLKLSKNVDNRKAAPKLISFNEKKKLLGSSLAFTLKEGPVRCAKVCDKSWVIL